MDTTTNNGSGAFITSTATTTTATCWTQAHHHHDHIIHQIPNILASPPPSIFPNYHHLLQMHHQTTTTTTTLPSTSSSSSSGFLGDILGVVRIEQQDHEEDEEPEEELGAMKEMMYKIAAMQPVDIDPATIRKPKRRNVRISDDPQSVAARHRRERISEKIRILQRLVPGGTKMDTASMLDEAIRYVKFLKRQIRLLQSTPPPPPPPQPPQSNYINPIINTNTAFSLGPPPTSDWPFAPAAASSSSLLNVPAAITTLGFNAGDPDAPL
ncbi:hypothetical protein PIB30_012871 [Stylosanthes scabra]|uniref:BHLH domain-containing protein n=1 Tax=Stylosanthes scabra TaxID=79078 RepID=A0ABU6W4A1_9FABA|nr:hypothetical protein [Stylosanthes scabra]